MEALNLSSPGESMKVRWDGDEARISFTAESGKVMDGGIKIPSEKVVRGEGARL